MYESDFSIRLSKLRNRKGVSARDMSLSIGQNAGYINNIETGKALPSMAGFFYICEYLKISPMEFFDYDLECPAETRAFMENLKLLTPEQMHSISVIVEGLAKKQT